LTAGYLDASFMAQLLGNLLSSQRIVWRRLIILITLVHIQACVTPPNSTESQREAKPLNEQAITVPALQEESTSTSQLNDLSLKELINIPLNDNYSQHTIHQLTSNKIDDKTINFGILAPISEFPIYSAEIIAAADMAAQLVNKNGGINGRWLVILRADDRENTPVSAMLAKQLVEDYKVEAIIGPATSNSVADVLRQVAIPNNIPIISQAASSMLLSEIGGDHAFWRMVANNSQQLNLMVDYLHQQLDHDKVFLITGRDIYSREIASGLTDYFEQVESGWTDQLAISDLVYLAEMNLEQEIKSFQKQGVTAVVITLVNDQVQEMIQKIQQHWEGKYPIIMVGDTVTPKYLIDAELGDISACIFSYVGTPKDLQASLGEKIAKAIDTNATGFDSAYIFDATMILSMAKVLSEKFNLPMKQAVQLLTGDGHPIKHSDFSILPDLYQQHRVFSYYGFSGRVHFNQQGDNLTAYTKVYSIANDPKQTQKHCINVE